jgi:hypothetical protein
MRSRPVSPIFRFESVDHCDLYRSTRTRAFHAGNHRPLWSVISRPPLPGPCEETPKMKSKFAVNREAWGMLCTLVFNYAIGGMVFCCAQYQARLRQRLELLALGGKHLGLL